MLKSLFFLNKKTPINFTYLSLFLLSMLGLSGCNKPIEISPDEEPLGRQERLYSRMESLNEGNALALPFLGSRKKEAEQNTPSGLVAGQPNPFLWRASLEIIGSTFPIHTVSATSGVINTGWVSPPHAPEERFSATVFVLSPHLEAHSIKVILFYQRRAQNRWQEQKPPTSVINHIEESIVRRARQIAYQERTKRPS